MRTPTAQQQFDYDMGDFWRSAWLKLAKWHDHGRLQSTQERIERRARFANARVGRALDAFDADRAKQVREQTVDACSA